jgi:hypothetical protein
VQESLLVVAVEDCQDFFVDREEGSLVVLVQEQREPLDEPVLVLLASAC